MLQFFQSLISSIIILGFRWLRFLLSHVPIDFSLQVHYDFLLLLGRGLLVLELFLNVLEI
jgi:hypothetical protein